jgi:parallel beta-helix repeat protein
MNQCPYCGEILDTPKVAKFCTNCGSKLAAPMQKQFIHIPQRRPSRRPSPSYRPGIIIIGIIVTIGIVLSVILIGTSFLGSLWGGRSLGSGIEIFSDTDFLEYSSDGSGTMNDPYILSNYYLSGEFFGFSIHDTTKHFIIGNCTIDMCYEGIHVENIAPGTGRIINNIIFHSDCRVWDTGPHAGITAYSSPRLTIVNNSISNAGSDGIVLENSPESLISNNTISEQYVGIRIEYSDSSIVSANSLFHNYYAIDCFDSNFMRITDNICTNNDKVCISVGISSLSILLNNSCKNSGWDSLFDAAILLAECNNCTVANSTIINCLQGIYAPSTSCSQFYFNHLENNSNYGISVQSGWLEAQSNMIYLNSFINNNPNELSQALDNGTFNTWYYSELEQGNYWSDWNGTDSYSIAGSANAIDLYPLNEPPD